MFQTLLNLLGGLAVFLFAVNMLGSHLQSVVGTKIETVLHKLTDRPYKGMMVGALVTFLTQSSSITVLALIGLVNVGSLTLRQGMGILLGAEIGTTITAQLVAFKIGLMYFPLLIIGLWLANHKEAKMASIGKVIFSFGLLFLGIELMKQGAAPIKNSPVIMNIFEQFGAIPILGILIGALFTGLTSSSSATTSLVVALGATGSITLPAGIALIVGANIGTTFLELIAVAGMALTSKRIAIAQALINVLGVMIIYPFLKPFSVLVASTAESLSRQVANAHTIFNLSSSLFFLCLINFIVYLTKKLVPGKVVKLENGTKYLDANLLKTPYVAISSAAKEVNRMGKITLSMLSHVKKYLKSFDSSLISVVSEKEDSVDNLHEKISDYLALISQKELDKQAAYRVSFLTHGVTDLERTADHIKQMIIFLPKKSGDYTEATRRKIISMINASEKVYQQALRAYAKLKVEPAKEVINKAGSLSFKKNQVIDSIRVKDKLKKQEVEKLIYHVERVAHHGSNLAHIVLYGT